MGEMNEKAKRLAEWHETLSGTIVSGSYDAWHAELRQGVRMMKTEGLITGEEAREMLELADAAHSHMIESLNDR